MKIMKMMIVVMIFLLYSGCAKEPEYELIRKVNYDCGFDTMCQLNAYVQSEEEFNAYYESMNEMFSYYNDLFDIYNNYDGLNNIKTVNDMAGIEPVKVDGVLIELIELAEKIHDISDGAFDITDGATLKIWHEYRDVGKIKNQNGEYGSIPSTEELDAVKEYKGFEYIEIDKEASTVYITDPNVSLDVGGIAKGFATEKIAKTLEEAGLKYGAVNAGGNQRIIGTQPDGSGYNVGITDPRGSGNIAVIPDQKEVSVVTSGDYQNYYFADDGQRYSHIIDPETSFPATYYTSVTVVVPDSGIADCLSTAFFVLDYEEGLELIEKVNEAYGLDIIVVWISEKPLDDTSILSPMTDTQEYITCSENFRESLVTE